MILLSLPINNYTLSLFFFFKQKTAYEITRRDWSSDVCSSDLKARNARDASRGGIRHRRVRARVAVAVGQRLSRTGCRVAAAHGAIERGVQQRELRRSALSREPSE